MYQEVGETVDDFVNRLKDKASKCGFKIVCAAATTTEAEVAHDITHEFVQDRLIVGLANNAT